MIEILTAFALNMPLLNNLLLLAFFFTFAIVFWRESKNKESKINWTDLLVDSKSQKVSLTKLGQFWGIALSSWVVVYMVQKLSAESVAGLFLGVFGTWLTFLVAQAGIRAYKTMNAAKDTTLVESTEVDKNDTK